MQITLKTLQQQTFRIDIDPEETVLLCGLRCQDPWCPSADGNLNGNLHASGCGAEDAHNDFPLPREYRCFGAGFLQV